MNTFADLRNMVSRILTKYEETLKSINVPKSHINTVKKKCEPFLKGYFTLAVVGEMSSGKSTFINALVNKNGLLPSGIEQTTILRTVIVDRGDETKESVCVKFADGSSKTYYDLSYIRGIVDIDEKFEDLPLIYINSQKINNVEINDLVVDPLIDEKAGHKVDRTLLKLYYDQLRLESIAVEVSVKVSLPDEFKGWRIVDTPGVNAIGGFEDETKVFLNDPHQVDAIVFVVNGNDASFQKASLHNFIKTTINNLSKESQKRIFMVLSNCGKSQESEQFLDKSIPLFVNQYPQFKDRIFGIDSILELFNSYCIDAKYEINSFKKANPLPGWEKAEWNSFIQVRNNCRDYLFENDEETTNEHFLTLFDSMSGFGKFRESLREFLSREKNKIFADVVSIIKSDLVHFSKDFQRQKEQIGVKINNNKSEKEEYIATETRKMSDFKAQCEKKSETIKPDLIELDIPKLIKEANDDVMRMIDQEEISLPLIKSQLLRYARNIFDYVKSYLDTHFNGDESVTYTYVPIEDFFNLNESELFIYEEKLEAKEGLGSYFARLFGRLFSSDWGYKTTVVSKVDSNKLCYQVEMAWNSYSRALNKFVSKAIKDVMRNVDLSIENNKKELEKIRGDYSNQQALLEEQLEIISKNIITLEDARVFITSLSKNDKQAPVVLVEGVTDCEIIKYVIRLFSGINETYCKLQNIVIFPFNGTGNIEITYHILKERILGKRKKLVVFDRDDEGRKAMVKLTHNNSCIDFCSSDKMENIFLYPVPSSYAVTDWVLEDYFSIDRLKDFVGSEITHPYCKENNNVYRNIKKIVLENYSNEPQYYQGPDNKTYVNQKGFYRKDLVDFKVLLDKMLLLLDL